MQLLYQAQRFEEFQHNILNEIKFCGVTITGVTETRIICEGDFNRIPQLAG